MTISSRLLFQWNQESILKLTKYHHCFSAKLSLSKQSYSILSYNNCKVLAHSKNVRKRENSSPQHGTSFCEGGVTPPQSLQEEVIASAAASDRRSTKRANYLTSPVIRVDVGALKVSPLNQMMSKPHSVSPKDQTACCDGEETSTSKSHPTSVFKGEEMKQEMTILVSNEANVRSSATATRLATKTQSIQRDSIIQTSSIHIK